MELVEGPAELWQIQMIQVDENEMVLLVVMARLELFKCDVASQSVCLKTSSKPMGPPHNEPPGDISKIVDCCQFSSHR